MRKTCNLLILALIALQIADASLTSHALAHHTAEEANPVCAFLFGLVGVWPVLILAKATVIGLLLGLMAGLHRSKFQLTPTRVGVLFGVTSFYVGVVVHNLGLVI